MKALLQHRYIVVYTEIRYFFPSCDGCPETPSVIHPLILNPNNKYHALAVERFCVGILS